MKIWEEKNYVVEFDIKWVNLYVMVLLFIKLEFCSRKLCWGIQMQFTIFKILGKNTFNGSEIVAAPDV